MPTARGTADKSQPKTVVSNLEKIFKLSMKAIQIFNDSGGATAVQIFTYIVNNHRIPLSERELKDGIKESLKRGILAGILRRRSEDGKYYIFPGTKFATTKRLPITKIIRDFCPPPQKPKVLKKQDLPPPHPYPCHAARSPIVPRPKPREVTIVSHPRIAARIKSSKGASKTKSPAHEKVNRKRKVKESHHAPHGGAEASTNTRNSTERAEKRTHSHPPQREPVKSKAHRDKSVITRPRDVILLQAEKAARNAQKNATKEKIKSLKRKLAKEAEEERLSAGHKRPSARPKSTKAETVKETTPEAPVPAKNSDVEKEQKASS